MDDAEFLKVFVKYQDSSLGTDELSRFEQELTSDARKRSLFAETLLQATILHEQFRQDAFSVPELRAPSSSGSKSTAGRHWVAAAMLLLGLLLGSGAVWATASPRLVVATEIVSNLVDGGFEANPGPPTVGFPSRIGVWSGDGFELASEGAKQGRRRLRFAKVEPDANLPQARAIACDLFQLVDLRGLIGRRHEQGTSVLELSAEFMDARAKNTNPSVSFFCQIYLFQGDPAHLHQTWPLNVGEAVASGSASTTTLGESGWRNVTARCLMPPEADFAVIHLSAMPNLRVPMPNDLFADDVRLVVKTQPLLPMSGPQR